MADFEDVIKTIEKEGKSFRKLLADQKKSGESPAKRDAKEKAAAASEKKGNDLLEKIDKSLNAKGAEGAEKVAGGGKSLWGMLKKALLFGTIALAVPAIQGFLEADGWKKLKTGFEKLKCFLIDVGKYIEEEIFPLLTIENFKLLAKRLNEYIFTPLGNIYRSLVNFFGDLFSGCYDEEIKKIKDGLNKYIFIPLGKMYKTISTVFKDLEAGCYDEEIKKIKVFFNKYILSPLTSLGKWVSSIEIADLDKIGEEINEGLIKIGGFLAATQAVFKAIAMPITGLLLLYDTISDLFKTTEKQRQQQLMNEIEQRRIMAKILDPNMPLGKDNAAKLKAAIIAAGAESSTIGDMGGGPREERSASDAANSHQRAGENRAIQKEKNKRKDELDASISSNVNARAFHEKRLTEGGLAPDLLARTQDAVTRASENIAEQEKELKKIKEELKTLEKEKDMLNRAARTKIGGITTTQGLVNIHPQEAIIPLEKMDDVINKINTAAINKSGASGAPIVMAPSVVNAPTDARSSTTIHSGNPVPISAPFSYSSILDG